MTTSPHARRLETWAWVAIYGGLLLFALGLATGRTDAALGWMIALPGAALTLAGIALIVVRAKLKDR